MAKEVFNRFEKKYFVTEEQMPRVLEEIEKHMTPDKNNINRKLYSISNIYFDTADDYLIRKSLSKPVYKEKIRLRAYGVPEKEDIVFLEIKKKVDGLVNKRRTKMALEDAFRFIENGGKIAVEDYMNPQVLKELSYMVGQYKLYPKVLIAYDRMAYFEKGNKDLRISFDTNIRSRRDNVRLEAGNYGTPLLQPGLWLMEIKTSKAMPLWLTNLLAREQIRKMSFSKYGTEFKNFINSREDRRVIYA
ncbi:polyphosphate polymerase domain-containing protein [Aminipila luticellarii]|uniref:Polyphosphate polymerase domain-containing protein n=1 Tax=Aminipila luticellarii TaxID=2507160 RepID=A0A410PX23_9FIRM|nr:polyphosphate polymerase domain-containing protein [Aminipila luticellarii]QAT43491.1 polyphosphate polymerase domain-containing protein [Aminipila luticellarii]